MRCKICDSELTDKEVDFDDRGNSLELEPCTTCLDIIMDAAYCNGFERYPSEHDVTIESDFDGDTIPLEDWMVVGHEL